MCSKVAHPLSAGRVAQLPIQQRADFMLSIDECRKYVGDEITDKQLEGVRDALYVFVGGVVDAYFDQKLTKKSEGISNLQTGSNHVPIQPA